MRLVVAEAAERRTSNNQVMNFLKIAVQRYEQETLK